MYVTMCAYSTIMCLLKSVTVIHLILIHSWYCILKPTSPFIRRTFCNSHGPSRATTTNYCSIFIMLGNCHSFLNIFQRLHFFFFHQHMFYLKHFFVDKKFPWESFFYKSSDLGNKGVDA